MPNPFTAFAFPASGSNQVNRTMPDRISDVHNVKDYGAKGDGVTDDWAAITSAFTLGGNTTLLFFPPGTYYVSQPLNFGDINSINTNVSLQGVGPLSVITGNFADYVIKRGANTSGGEEGSHTISDLAVTNTNAAGGAIRWGLNTGAALRNLLITANLGINTASIDAGGSITSQETSIENCIFSPGSNPTNSIAIMSVANGQIANCSIIGFQTGAMVWGQQGEQMFTGCRFELCQTGIAGGQDPTLGSPGNSGYYVLGCYFKNCGTALDFSASSGCFALGVRIESTNATVFGSTPQYGIKGVNNGGQFRGVFITGQFAQAGIDMSGITTSFKTSFSYRGVTVNNTGAGSGWALPNVSAFVASNNFLGCNVAPVWTMGELPAVTTTVSSASWSSGTATLTISGLNLSGYVSAGITLNINVQGISPSGYNGVFTGAVATAFNTLTYTVANPGGSGGSGTVLINPVNASPAVENASEGDCYNVSDATTSTWASNPVGGGSTHAKVRWGTDAATNWSVAGI